MNCSSQCSLTTLSIAGTYVDAVDILFSTTFEARKSALFPVFEAALDGGQATAATTVLFRESALGGLELNGINIPGSPHIDGLARVSQ